MYVVPHSKDVSVGPNGSEQAGWRWIPVSSSNELRTLREFPRQQGASECALDAKMEYP